MNRHRGVMISLWTLTALSFLTPWALFLPLNQRWSMAGIFYLVGFLIWISYLIVQHSKPERPATAKSLQTLLITHFILVPLFWVGTGIYALNWISAKNLAWHDQAMTQLDAIPVFNQPEMEWMKNQLLPLLVIRNAATDPDLNDARWLIEHQLQWVDVQKQLQSIEQAVQEVKSAAQLKTLKIGEIKGNAAEKKEKIQAFREDARNLIQQLGQEQRQALMHELQQLKSEK